MPLLTVLILGGTTEARALAKALTTAPEPPTTTDPPAPQPPTTSAPAPQPPTIIYPPQPPTTTSPPAPQAATPTPRLTGPSQPATPETSANEQADEPGTNGAGMDGTGTNRTGTNLAGTNLAGTNLAGTDRAGRTGNRFDVISSLAGRTSAPLLPAGEVRIGGFGGVEGLVAYLRERRVDVLVDATHPFAARISANAAAAAARSGVPLLALRRPGWCEQPGDDWHRVPALAEAAVLLPRLGRRVFLTTGRQEIAAFAALDECWFLARSVEPPAPPTPRHLEVVLARGPFTLDGELRLLRDHRIDVLVTKDSGGAAAKLAAARKTRIPVVMVDRPPSPTGVPTATTVSDAVAWLGNIG